MFRIAIVFALIASNANALDMPKIQPHEQCAVFLTEADPEGFAYCVQLAIQDQQDERCLQDGGKLEIDFGYDDN